MSFAVHELCELGPFKLHDAESFHLIHAPFCTVPQAQRALVMSLVLLSSCIGIIAIVAQIKQCWSSCKAQQR